ncbi:hypothetical protein RLIN73S_00274 [Rhodanobacter lindaniclasticus]
MDLVGAEVERGVLADLLAVVGLAVRHRLGRQRGARVRHVVVTEELQQLGVGRDHVVADVLQRLALQGLRLVGGDRRWQLLERLVEAALRGVLQLGHGGDGNVAPGEHLARHAETALQAQPHVGDLLVEVGRDLAQPIEVPAVVVDAAQAVATQLVADVRPERRVAVERHLPGLEFLVGQQVADLRVVDLEVDPVGRRQLRHVDGVELFHHALPVVQPPLLAGRADIVEPAGVAGSSVRTAGMTGAPGPLGGVDALELRIRAAVCSRRCSHGRRQHKQAERQRRGGQANDLRRFVQQGLPGRRSEPGRTRRDPGEPVKRNAVAAD